MHLSPSRTGPLDRSRNDLGLSPCVAFVLACCSPPPMPPQLRTRLRRRPTRMWPAVPVHHRLPSFCMLSLGWPRDSPGCRSLAASALWILVVRFLPSTGRGRSPVGTLEQHCDSAGPGRQLTTVSALGWRPRQALWGDALSASPTALAVGGPGPDALRTPLGAHHEVRGLSSARGCAGFYS